MEEKKRQKKWVKTLQFLAAYLVAAWTFLQFLEWILKRYGISPNWVDLFLWIFVGIIPSLAIYLYNQERLNKKVLKLREKIIFPLNIILLVIVMYFGFGNSDLGATTKEISFTNDNGELEKRTITKEEFRIGLPIFSFKYISKDTSYTWLEDGIAELLHQDLLQDKNISSYTSDSEGTVNKVSEAKIFNDYYLDGTFEINDSLFKVTPQVRNAKNGKVLSQKTFEGPELLDILDEVSVYARDHIGIVEGKRDFYIDLDLKEFYSSSLEAIRYNIEGNYQKAQDIDPTFAISYLENAMRNIRYSFGAESEKKLIGKAFKYSNKLPLQRQLQIRILRYIAYEEWETAEKLLKLQLEIDPSDETYNRLLYTVFGETKQIDAYMARAEYRFTKNRSIDNGTNLLNASLVSGHYQEVISAIKNLELVQPNNPDIFTFKLRPQLLSGDIEGAKKTQELTKIRHPEWENFTRPFDSAIAYLSKNKMTRDRLKNFVGTFRSQASEQTFEFWIEDERLICYVSNQELRAPIVAGTNTLLIGSYIDRNVNSIEFLKDESGRIYGTKNTDKGYKTSNVFWYWSYDKYIKNAETALINGNLEEAEVLYKEAIEKYPNHYFLKYALQHIEYITSISDDDLMQQYQSITGNYKARKFWIEDGKLFYERKGLTKMHILPISKDRYISLSRYGIQYAFETTHEGKRASAVYSYKNETETWEKSLETDNYLLKDD